MEEKRLRTLKIILTMFGIIMIGACLGVAWMSYQAFYVYDKDPMTLMIHVLLPIFIAIIIVPFLMIGYKLQKKIILKYKTK